MRNSGVRIAKIFGIELWLDYSWFLLFFLIGATFIAGIIPARYPALSPPSAFFVGLVITVLFFVSVILHEISHSLYAKRHGLHIKRITLFIFGGASEVMDEPKSPRQEFMLAAAGPLASLALGLIFGAVWFLGQRIGFLPFVATGGTLAVINIVLALFNLLPGFPLDGGRMFRAIAWQRTGDLEKATRLAAAGGRILGLALIFYGFLQILYVGLLGGVWAILIGIFLHQAATLSYGQTVSRLILKDARVADLMDRQFVAVPRLMSIRDFLKQYVLRYKESVMIVEADDSHAADLIDARTIPEPVPDGQVGSFSLHSATLRPQDTAAQALDAIVASGQNKLPVVEKGKLVGVLSVGRIRAYIVGKHKLAGVEGALPPR